MLEVYVKSMCKKQEEGERMIIQHDKQKLERVQGYRSIRWQYGVVLQITVTHFGICGEKQQNVQNGFNFKFSNNNQNINSLFVLYPRIRIKTTLEILQKQNLKLLNNPVIDLIGPNLGSPNVGPVPFSPHLLKDARIRADKVTMHYFVERII